jgi:ketosteroid isomerase-like protein
MGKAFWRLGAAGSLAAAVWLGLGAAAVASPPPAVQQILDTERAFAQQVAQAGIGPGFRQYAAPDAVMFLPDPAPALPILDHAHWPGELLWRPQFIAAAGSGDLGFSAGPSLLRAGGKALGGYYLTVWKRVDGGWRFVVDRGVDMPPAVFAGPPQPIEVLQADGAAPPAEEGMREADASLNSALPKGAGAAFGARLDARAVLVRANRPVASGRARALQLVEDSPPILEAKTLGGGLSADGAFGYAFGRARWSTGSSAQTGYYVRVWRSSAQGWRLLADHMAER